MQRHGFGLFGILFLTGYIYLLISGEGARSSFAAGICVRVGLLLVAIWLAWPQLESLLQRFPPWLLGTLLASVLIVAVRPRTFLYIGPVLAAVGALQFVGWLFKPPTANPRTGKRSPRPPGKND